MNNAELIKALKDAEGYVIYVAPNCYASCEAIKAIRSAADALKAADKRIAELEAQEPTEKQVVDYCRKRCLVIVTGELIQRMKATFSLLLKEGEWIEVHDWLHIPQEERGTYRCSACGQVMKYPWNYCPNCGTKMRRK